MKKVVSLFCFIFALQIVYSQNTNFARDSLYKVLQNANNPSEQINAWIDIGENYGHAGQTDSLRYVNEQILKIATTTHQDSLLAKVYIQLGFYFGSISDDKLALEYQFKSLELAEETKNSDAIWIASKEIGFTYKRLKNYSQALRYLRKSIDYLNEVSLYKSVAKNRTYTNIAEVFVGLKQTDSALHYVQLSNEHTSKELDAYGYARVLYIFATVYKSIGDFDIAESYYKKCIAFSDSSDIYYPYITATTEYGRHLYDTKQFNLSLKYALNAFNKALLAENKLEVINTAALLRKVYFAIGQKDSANFYADLKDAYSDSVFNEQQISQIQNISLSQFIKEHIEKDKILEEKRQHRLNLQYTLIAAGIIVLFTLYLLLSRSFITSSKLIEFFGVITLLIVFEFLNLLLHPFLEKITNHSPLLMLFGLVCIAALLVPLHHKIEKWTTMKLVKKNRIIRLAIAKKTIQKLEINDVEENNSKSVNL